MKTMPAKAYYQGSVVLWMPPKAKQLRNYIIDEIKLFKNSIH